MNLKRSIWWKGVCSDPGNLPGALRVDQEVWMCLDEGPNGVFTGQVWVLVNDHLTFWLSNETALAHFDMVHEPKDFRYVEADQEACREMWTRAEEACRTSPEFTQNELEGLLDTIWKFESTEYVSREEMVWTLHRAGSIKDGEMLEQALGWARLNNRPLLNPGDR